MYESRLSKPRPHMPKQLNCQQGNKCMGTRESHKHLEQVAMPPTLNIVPTPHVLHAFPGSRRHTGCGRDVHRALFSCTATTLVPARQGIVLFHPSTHPPHP
ncbi:unnamed protein product, partial [Ectocarpus sp. 12 AP-2014]